MIIQLKDALKCT